MTALVRVAIACDTCGMIGPVRRSRVWLARAALNRAGWHRNNGVDVCQQCWRAGARGPVQLSPSRRPAVV